MFCYVLAENDGRIAKTAYQMLVNGDSFMKYLSKVNSKWQLKYKQFKQRSYLLLAGLLTSRLALADQGDTVTTVIYNICNWLSGPPAIGIGILAVIYSGYEMVQGEIAKQKMIVRCLGIGLVIGAAFIGKNIILKGIGS